MSLPCLLPHPTARGLRGAVRAALAAAVLALPGAALAEPPAKTLFGALSTPSTALASAIGSYAKGCMAGAVELPETGPSWQAMRLSRNRNWGHPETIAFIARLGEAAQRAGWAGIYVGDIAQPRGGPMTSGHASHQIGLDADIWMLPPRRLDLTRAEREALSSISMRSADGRHVTANWTPAHAHVLRAAAQDPSVERIFITAPVKQMLCQSLPASERGWLHKLRPWWGHDTHFHVRLTCPAGSPLCAAQDPIPAGDGCDDTLAWWTSDEALNPPPPDPKAAKPQPKPALTLADLPAACRGVLSAP
ncbi:penicillin-insensitive murein endopeptidase [Paroceanicella profunda]|uniref:Penicillin-insensitive murein endopeptidase n=1 Tax=Paroceanicella profunda TaxID=2579971 RepID=A0A5B8FQ25_9RHOB|nr:penicillin-insensitive murein endopeptidase [Paroceanicella profunda]QDL90435.1 penicillin-insensitive murein endopeptidase [Paroceanicella profunda]